MSDGMDKLVCEQLWMNPEMFDLFSDTKKDKKDKEKYQKMVKELQETKEYFEMRSHDQETNRFLRVIVEGEKTEGDFFHKNLSLEAAYKLIEPLDFDSYYEAKEKLAPIIKLINFLLNEEEDY